MCNSRLGWKLPEQYFYFSNRLTCHNLFHCNIRTNISCAPGPVLPFEKVSAFSNGSCTSWVVLRLMTRNLFLWASYCHEKSGVPFWLLEFHSGECSGWETSQQKSCWAYRVLWIAFQGPSRLGSSFVCPVCVPITSVLFSPLVSWDC